MQIPRSQNMVANEVTKLASSEEGLISLGLDMEVQKRPSIEEISIFAIQNTGGWMSPIMNDTLYKRGFSMPYLKCVDEEEVKYILEKIHEGVCGNHAGLGSLVSKAVKTGYLWPTMQVDAREIVRKCDKCQRFGNVQCLPT